MDAARCGGLTTVWAPALPFAAPSRHPHTPLLVQIKAHPWSRVFSKRMPADAVDLVRRMWRAALGTGRVWPPRFAAGHKVACVLVGVGCGCRDTMGVGAHTTQAPSVIRQPLTTSPSRRRTLADQ